MDLNGSCDYKLHRRAGWVRCFRGPGGCRDVEKEDGTESTGVASELVCLLHRARVHVRECVYTDVWAGVCVHVGQRGNTLFPPYCTVLYPSCREGGAVSPKEAAIQLPLFSWLEQRRAI